MTMKSPHTDRIESGRKILNAPTSTIVELEASETLVRHVLVETDVELKEMAQRRKAILASDAPSGDLDKQVERHDETVRALTRRNEIAAALATKLATRIAADREVERAAKQQAALDEALEVHKAATRIVEEGLREMGETVRRILRVYDESEMLTPPSIRTFLPARRPSRQSKLSGRGKFSQARSQRGTSKLLSITGGASPNRAMCRPRRRKTAGGASSFRAGRRPAETT
jgi:hypothetical protein